MHDIDIIGKIADLKEVDYHNTLALAALIELLIAKGCFTRQEFARQAQALDAVTLDEIDKMRCNTKHRLK